MTDFIGTAGNDTANAVTGDFSGFSGGTITDLQDGTGDFINGFFGEDFIFAGDAADLIYGGEGHDIVNGGGGNDTVYAYTEADPGGSFTGDDISGNLGNDSIFGSSGDDTLAGDSGTDQLFGNDGADILQGGEDWDTLDGGAGADQMSGGLGDDTYYVDRKADQVIEAAGEGYDVVHTTVSFTAGVGIEEVNLEGTGKISAVGNGLVNYLLGNDNANALYGLAGNDILIGGEGVDQMFGGRGDDKYYVDQPAGEAFEAAGQGDDTVFATALPGASIYSLPPNVENLFLGGSINFTALTDVGNELDNEIRSVFSALDSGPATLLGLGGMTL